jgi:prophage regulatory protein
VTQKQDSRWPRLLRREDAAAYLGVCPNTFDRLVKEGEIPGPKHFTKAEISVWDIRDLDACADNMRYGTAENQPDMSWA